MNDRQLYPLRAEKKFLTIEQIFSKVAHKQNNETTEWNEFLNKGGGDWGQNNITLKLLMNSVYQEKE